MLSNSIEGLLRSKGEMTSSDVERELSENPRSIIYALNYLVRKGRIFYKVKITGRFSARRVYFVQGQA